MLRHRMHRPLTYAALSCVAIVAACNNDTPTMPRSPRPKLALGKVDRAAGKIAFVRDSMGLTSIWTLSADGVNAVRITEDGSFAEPALSADGRRIAYVRRTPAGGPDSIFVGTASGGRAHFLTVGGWPRWSPDGSEIVFHRRVIVPSGTNVHVIGADGSNERALTTLPDDGFFPSWSPDGRKIAFTSTRLGNHEIFVMDADGTDVTRVTRCTDESALCAFPAWSPVLSDDRLAFLVLDPVGEIRTIRPDGTGSRTLLTDLTVAEMAPVWSPDGARLAFHSRRDTPGVEQVYSMFRDGTDMRRLTFAESVGARFPFWSR